MTGTPHPVYHPTLMGDGLNAWDRRASESDAAFKAFTRYRDLGPTRSLAKTEGNREATGGQRKPPSGRITGWSARHDWVARAAAYDAHLDQVRVEATERAARLNAASAAEFLTKMLAEAHIHADIGNTAAALAVWNSIGRWVAPTAGQRIQLETTAPAAPDTVSPELAATVADGLRMLDGYLNND